MKAGETGTLTRREVAAQLEIHPDSVTRSLHEGLACAVVTWGGRGKQMTFDPRLVERWRRARGCPRGGCFVCRAVVAYDCDAVAEHLIEKRHGFGGCRDCRISWTLESSWPCMTAKEWLRRLVVAR